MLSPASLDVLAQPRMPLVSVSSQPVKVLDAPDIADDYYLNILDWSSNNLLGVGLGRNVYIWNAVTSDVTKLCEVEQGDSVTCLSWMPQGNHVAVATKKGIIKIWDVQRCGEVRTYLQHSRRVCAMAWCGTTLASGGRGRVIVQRDVRDPSSGIKELAGHSGEICGLRWSPSNTQLASGANDNRVFIWDRRRAMSELWQFKEHTAAVKAIAWSPHQEGLLATGGGSQDGHIRFWNTLSGTALNCVDTQSQVCNLAWSRHDNELVSTHGYVRNDLRIWRYPLLRQVNAFSGHTNRVLYMAVSPDGRTVVTGTPDETLRFWQVFSHSRHHQREDNPLSTAGLVR
ncbi:WD40-repeat-containing domain protein [Syncephalis pseudoplumigaleata]|uniref:WD40-repeat-containing domain protein n=1 Tax=Syncephalis pseudoplumigaleata TaxID=1712513 RepID=A0A4P9Z6H2_9FUNG|nr:WD40-repeat-containing domain protein [Syncephalis pseudoplumigaleata]|eukprot:RKP27270.1 WD40-repeat-containing domain protein [Syncephalis pseudoplumigaleata]